MFRSQPVNNYFFMEFNVNTLVTFAHFNHTDEINLKITTTQVSSSMYLYSTK